jgi:malate dehydrogenase
MGVPTVIGGDGIERIIEIDLTGEERAMLDKSAASVQKVIDIVKAVPHS